MPAGGPRSPGRCAALTRFVIALVLLSALATFSAPPSVLAAPSPAKPYFAPLPAKLIESRQTALAAPLPDGEVLIAGGSFGLTSRNAETFDPVTDSFHTVPYLMRHVRRGATGAPLPDGSVLIVGGFNNVSYTEAEIFDPATQKFTEVPGEMTMARNEPISAPLPDGEILVAGGFSEGESRDSAEVFDPATETFSALGTKPAKARSGAISASLPDGRVLIFGGQGRADQTPEVFDPATDTFSLLGPKLTGPEGLAAGALLPDGKLLVAGGDVGGGFATREAAIFDPLTATYSPLPAEGTTELTTERSRAPAAPLPDGKILIAGGSWPAAEDSAELFVPAPEVSYAGADLGELAVGQSATKGTIVVTNVGAQKLWIESASLSGDAALTLFSDSCSGQTIAFRASCTIEVAFSPSSPGTARSALHLVDNEPTSTTIPVSATAVPAVATNPGDGGATSDGAGSLATGSEVRRHGSVACGSRPSGRRKTIAICQVDLGRGNWELQLRHGGRTIATRRLSGGPHRLRFVCPRSHGGYHLQFTPTA